MKYNLRKGLYLLMAILCVGWVQAQTTTIYVSPTGGGDGTEGNPTTLSYAIDNARDGDIIKMSAATYSLSSQLVINKAITLEGAGIGKTKLEPASTWDSSLADSQQDLVSIENQNPNNQEEGKVTIKGITIQKSKGNGINVQTSRSTTIDSVRIYKSTKYGMVIHSFVSATDLQTSSNGWGGVNVDEGTPLYPTIKFTFDNESTTFGEQLMIYDETASMNAVEGPDYGWVSKEITGEKPGKAWTYGLVSSTGGLLTGLNVYANGYPITIEEDPNGTYVRIYRTNYPKNYIQGSPSKTYVYGGSLDTDVENTSITMKSGKVSYIFGGGATSTGSDKTANVTGTATIHIEGGTIKDYLVGGGNQKSKVNKADIKVTGTETNIAWIYAGGFASPAQPSLPYTWENTVCGVKDLTINITDATITGGLGCGGGQGYCYTGTSTITTNNAKIKYIYGTISNGYANKINATINGGSVTGFTTMNRGQVGDVTFIYNNCTFPETMTTVAYMGATRNWAGADWSTGSPLAQVNGSVTYSFNNCANTPYVYLTDGIKDANVELNGTKAIIDKFNRGNLYPEAEREVTAYSINNDKTWALNNGLTIADGVTLTKNGTLNIGVSSVEQLNAAIAAGADKVTMAAGEYDLTGQLTINHTMTLEGTFTGSDSTRLVRTTAWTGTTNSNKHMIGVQANNVELKNLIVDAKGTSSGASTEGSGIQAYNATGVKLTNVVARNTKAAGVIVNSSTVTADYLHTEGNAWGGVNTDKKTTGVPSFTFTNSTFDERPRQVWAEEANGSSVVLAPNGWRTLHENGFYIWTSDNMTKEDVDGVTYVYANGYAVTVSANGADQTDITSGNQTLTFNKTDKVYLFGGSKDASVENTNITMTGGSLTQIYGGGKGTAAKEISERKYADVTGQATITISGGAVTDRLIAAGSGASKVKKAVVNVSGNTTLHRVSGGGYAPTGIGENERVDYANIANGIEEVIFTIDGGSEQTVTIDEFVMAGGGFSYGYSQNVTFNINGAKIYGGVLGTGSNGRSDKVRVYVSNCDFTPSVSYTKEFAAINRGYVTDSVKMVFENCKFPETGLAVYACATLQWQNGSYPIPTTPNTEMVFTECVNTPTVGISEGLQNFTLTGADAKIAPFERKSLESIKTFTIPADNTWTLSGNLELDKDITFTVNGSLSVGGVCTVATNDQLTTIMNADVKNIALAAGTYKGFTVSKEGVHIQGNKSTINSYIKVAANDVTLNYMKMLPSSGSIIHANSNVTGLNIKYNYWGSEKPVFSGLISSTYATPYPYYTDDAMTTLQQPNLVVDSEQELKEEIFDGCNLTITKNGKVNITKHQEGGLKLGTVTIYEGGSLDSYYSFTADLVVYFPELVAGKWKAIGTPFESTLRYADGLDATLSDKNAQTGIWFAGLASGEPKIEVKDKYEKAGLWAADDGKKYGFYSKGQVTITHQAEPSEPNSGLIMCVNPEYRSKKITADAYVLNEDGTAFELQSSPTIKPFQSYVLADYQTRQTLRSIGTTDPNATGNEFVVKEGYYLTTERGAIVVHTAEPMELYVVAVSGAVVYRGTVADGERIAVPTGFYAVNGQMVRVK